MRIDATQARLQEIPVDLVDRNPENPRIFFRQEELNTLQESIRQHGIQVPISVFSRKGQYVLIDGERRWRCAIKLNLPKIPALVQPEPDPLTNVLLMFNIHALREQWDLLTIAVKLPKVINLLMKELQRRPTEVEISSRTGLNRSTIRRCKLLIELPESYREDLLSELKRPKSQQKITEDFFIEMERALRTVERAMPEILKDKNAARDALISKYRKGVIKDIIDLRYIPKIAKATRVHADAAKASHALSRVFKTNDYSVAAAFEDTVADAYSGKDLLSRLRRIDERLQELSPGDVDDALTELLRKLQRTIVHLLRGAR